MHAQVRLGIDYLQGDIVDARGIDELRLPVCAGARVLAAGFSDVDDDAGNDWSIAAIRGAGAATKRWMIAPCSLRTAQACPANVC